MKLIKLFIFLFIFNLKSESQLFNLITTLYNEKNPERMNEYLRCFKENINNSYIKNIYVFYENAPQEIPQELKHHKIKIIKIKGRPTYQQYFNFANKYLKKKLIIICNTDIFFDDSLSKLIKFDFNNNFIVLTRYNVPEYKGAWKRHTKSHDAWIFKTPIKQLNANFKLGIPGCENELLKLLLNNNFNVVNPSLTIKSWHVHKDDIRHYSTIYTGKYVINIPFTEIK